MNSVKIVFKCNELMHFVNVFTIAEVMNGYMKTIYFYLTTSTMAAS